MQDPATARARVMRLEEERWRLLHRLTAIDREQNAWLRALQAADPEWRDRNPDAFACHVLLGVGNRRGRLPKAEDGRRKAKPKSDLSLVHTCRECKQTFTARRRDHVFCGRRCYKRWWDREYKARRRNRERERKAA